ncbi:MAG: ARMT1-like domain-containing protein [Deltaproteobacteria bacterium]|nr:ARMT1-like domain-containing protein [Deltaproteobacteria bacterium]
MSQVRCCDDAGINAFVFDRLLIEELNKPIHYAVRGKPIINDVTWEDAVAAGIDQVAAIISSGVMRPAPFWSKTHRRRHRAERYRLCGSIYGGATQRIS